MPVTEICFVPESSDPIAARDNITPLSPFTLTSIIGTLANFNWTARSTNVFFGGPRGQKQKFFYNFYKFYKNVVSGRLAVIDSVVPAHPGKVQPTLGRAPLFRGTRTISEDSTTTRSMRFTDIRMLSCAGTARVVTCRCCRRRHRPLALKGKY